VATSIRLLRLRALVVVIWLLVGIVVLSNYTWSHYQGPSPYPRCGWTLLGRDLLFSLANKSPEETGVALSQPHRDPATPGASPVSCEQGS
jgi:hypothetical protein